ncbi:uncharacterized protein LOC142563915 isoform X1 [Dermacentor variabilis]|uniref:uncharacterized protein LOC142563915 isoform X1 n=1 Tax=Dermacentor variabilis TaxID=34621 RepID=UPI003F5B889B
MALQTQRYTLVGFSKELDRRSLHFVEPIPANRICKVCSLVPRMTAFLPCLHVVCKTCYEQCQLNDDNFCPLDGNMFREGDVDWRDFPADVLLRRQVKCWNEEAGCDVVMAASKLYEHFFQECDYHTTSCPKCLAVIPCKDICAHIRSDCTDYAVSRMSRGPQASSSDPEAVLRALNASLDARVGEMKDRLDEVLSESSAQSDRLSELSHCMNTIKEALLQPSASGGCAVQSGVLETAAGIASVGAVKEMLTAQSNRLRELSGSISSLGDTLSRAVEDTKRTSLEKLEQNKNNLFMLRADFGEHVAESTETLEEISQSLREFKEILLVKDPKPAINLTTSETGPASSASVTAPREIEEQREQRTPLQHRQLAQDSVNTQRCELFVKGIRGIKQCVNLDGFYDYSGERMYLSGYHLLGGVKFVKDDESVTVHARLKLLKGVNDDLLEWPFYRSLKLSAVHPTDREERHCTYPAFRSITHFGKPGPIGNKALFFIERSLCLEDLERDGYVVNDKLQLALELVPLVENK